MWCYVTTSLSFDILNVHILPHAIWIECGQRNVPVARSSINFSMQTQVFSPHFLYFIHWLLSFHKFDRSLQARSWYFWFPWHWINVAVGASMPYLESRSGTTSVELLAILGDSVVIARIFGCFFTEGVANSVNFVFISVEFFIALGCSTLSLLTLNPNNEIVTTNRITAIIALLLPNILLFCLRLLGTFTETKPCCCVCFAESRSVVQTAMSRKRKIHGKQKRANK